MGDWIRVSGHGGVNFPSGLTFTDIASGQNLNPSPPTSSQPRNVFYVESGYFRDVRISARNYSSQTISTGGYLPGSSIQHAINVDLWHIWPYPLTYGDFQSSNPPLGLPLDDGDFISAVREDGALPSNVVEIHIRSLLWDFKRINVPDGEGSSWTIFTGAPAAGGRKFEDGVGLWAHQIYNGQNLTFSKAKTIGLMSDTYTLRVDPSWIKPGSRVTFNWLRDSSAGSG